jgi:hypothetical protein
VQQQALMGLSGLQVPSNIAVVVQAQLLVAGVAAVVAD